MHRRTFLTASLGLGVTWRGGSSMSGEQPVREAEFQGKSRADLPTPALLVDLATFEANLRTMADHCRRSGCIKCMKSAPMVQL